MEVSDPLDRPSEMYLRMRGTSASGEEVSKFPLNYGVKLPGKCHNYPRIAFDLNLNLQTLLSILRKINVMTRFELWPQTLNFYILYRE